jgi:hypothetical protein
MEPQSFDTERCKAFVDKEFMQSALPSLVEFIRIDNMSKLFHTAEEWNSVGWDKLLKAGHHVKQWIDSSGVKGAKTEIIFDK